MKELNDIKDEITDAIEKAKLHNEERKAALAAEIKERMEIALSYTEFDEYIIEKLKAHKNTEFEGLASRLHDKLNFLKESLSSMDARKIALINRNPSAGCSNGFIKEIREHIKDKK